MGLKGLESPVLKKQGDLQQANSSNFNSDLAVCRREHKSPPIHNPAPDNSFHSLH